jgi:hypothetical protein
MNTGHKHYINTCLRNGNGVIELLGDFGPGALQENHNDAVWVYQLSKTQ